MQLIIVGYEPDCNCQHCGRVLRHGIKLNDGTVVGATCMDKVLTKPRVYMGRKYRTGAENIIRMAKIAERYTVEYAEKHFGIGLYQRTFEAVEAAATA